MNERSRAANKLPLEYVYKGEAIRLDPIQEQEWDAYDATTLLPMPEKTPSQELLERPITLEDRKRYTLQYYKMDHLFEDELDRSMTVAEMSRALDVTGEWIRGMATRWISLEESTPESQIMRTSSQKSYPIWFSFVLQEEKEFQDDYKLLGEYVSLSQMERVLHHDSKTIYSRAINLCIVPRLTREVQRMSQYITDDYIQRISTAKIPYLYARDSIKVLRHLDFLEATPTIKSLEAMSGHSYHKLRLYLQAHPNFFDDFATRDLEETSEQLRDVSRTDISDANGWLTERGLKRALQRNEYWIHKRLTDEHRLQGKERLTRKGQIYIHYPPSVFESLRAVRDSEEQPRATDEWITRTSLVQELGRSWPWIKARLTEEESASGEYHLDAYNRRFFYYPISTLHRLQKVSEQEKRKKAARQFGILTTKALKPKLQE